MSDDAPIDDDDDLELEPVDPEVIKHQQERVKRKSREAEDAVDIDEVFDAMDVGDPVDFDRLKQFRFTTRHMLIATAVLAVVMTIITRLGGCMGLFVSGCTALAAGWWFVLREEKRRLAKINEERQRFKARMAARRAAEDGEPVPEKTANVSSVQYEELNAEWENENASQRDFKFSFSMKELLITFTIAAVMLGSVQLLGGPQNAALLLGLIALVGLVIQAFGVEMPALVTLGWWILMVLYILVSIWAALFPGAG
ncbi:MAG: hypothetical protein AAGD11_00960 [Planctomycetota bacterium]